MLISLAGLPRSGKSQGKTKIFRGRGKVREFCKRSGKISVLVKVNENSGNLSFSSTKRSLQRCRSTTKINLSPTTQTKVLTLSCMDALVRSRSIPNCGKFFKMLLILSHGQSCVERGFSDNKDILSNNMQDQTLISYRMAYDGIKNQDGPIEDSVTKELLVSCRHAHARYQSCLNQKKKTEEASEKEKRKKEVQEELQSSRKKKERLEKMVQELTKEADELATEAETKHKMKLLVKSNAMRSKSREKRKEIENEKKKLS